MIGFITKVGIASDLILGAVLLGPAGLRPGDKVSAEMHEGGALSPGPGRAAITPDAADDAVCRVIRANDALFRRCS